MDIEINNCNNIDKANIVLSLNKLNIKFAPNGTGKSTISRAIHYSVTGDQDALVELLPFKLRRENPEGLSPTVAGIENLGNVMCFNEKYVEQFTFQRDELVSNSFEILIKTDAYKDTEREIDDMVMAIRQEFSSNVELDVFIKNLQELSDAFKLTSKGLSKASTGMKGLSSGNKLQHIPVGLEPYRPFIQSARNVEWIEWQTKGYSKFSDLADGCCPFCTNDSTQKKLQIQQVSAEYDKNVIKNLVGIITVLNELGEYFSNDARSRLQEITTLENGLEAQHESYLITVKEQTDNLIMKLNILKTLNGFTFNDTANISASLAACRLDLQFFSELQSIKTEEAIRNLNTSLANLMNQAGQLQGKISIQRSGMQRMIIKHKTDINNFLAYAGYRYRVDITSQGDKSQLKLQHIDFDGYLTDGSQHLSYGERNAFAIVLFMYECLAKKPGLIILDDPISSFDKNKKFAILEMLFRRKPGQCLKNQTVLMLTHDVEPIIDTLKSVRKMFNNQVTASYLRYSRGTIIEQAIYESDIRTFSQICQAIMESNSEDIIKIIYLRRYYEIMDDLGDAYQVLSNLLHGRVVPIDTRKEIVENVGHPEMTEENLQNGCLEINRRIPNFIYANILSIILDPQQVRLLYQRCQSGYEKLQVFRLIGLEQSNAVIRKFVNETYHVENEFICQLDPARFDLIPEYVIDECDNILFPPPPANDETIEQIA
ncbi:AAA family ATPase [Cronobacter sakazakii]|nr:AAA family ATPase [Cronobacter sakazakii]